MAIQETRTLPAPFIETLGQDYAKQLTGLTATPIDTSKFKPQVAPQDALQQRATTLTDQGIGAYQPFVQQAQQYMGPTGYQQFMSPYQTDVIDTSLAEFDRRRQMQEQQIRDQAVRSGNFGGGREGVQLAEFGAQSGRDRALLQAGLLQQGFGQAQGLAQQAAQQQLGLAGLIPQLQTGDISLLGQMGGLQQSQAQAQLDAQRESSRMAAFEPYERLGFYGQGATGLMGGYPGQYQFSSIPNPTPLQTALGVGSTIGGIIGALKPNSPYNFNITK
jgi:hypothetical protein